MKIGIIVFAYNRSKHLKKVLDGLRKNKGILKLYIFQDGLKCEEHRAEWENTYNVIKKIDWCNVIFKQAPMNRGLAASIISGVNKVFEENDAVIVLEDDCVPHSQFLEYMTKALEKYSDCKKVYHIGASSEPVDVIDNGTDAYFLGRINSWGWGTWKDRWVQFSNDYKMLGKIKQDPELNEWFELWGEDLEAHILGSIYGTTDTWAAFWALTVIMKKGYCMSPYESLIDNIGFDNSGVHCKAGKSMLKLRAKDKLSEIILPEKVEFAQDYQKAFSVYYPWVNPWIKSNYYENAAIDILELRQKKESILEWLKSKNISNIMLWGKGRLCDYLIEEFAGKISIEAIIETVPSLKEYRNIPIITYKDIPNDVRLIIIIPGYDINKIKRIVDNTELNSKLIPIDSLLFDMKKEQ